MNVIQIMNGKKFAISGFLINGQSSKTSNSPLLVCLSFYRAYNSYL